MNFKFWEWFKKKPEGDLRFLEWFELKKKADPNADPTDLSVLEEFHSFQRAVAISRAPMETISRFDIGDGVVIKGEVSNPNFADDAETLKRKLQHGIHQSVQTGPDTLRLNGVAAIGESITVVGKVNKAQLYDLGYDIKEENAQMVKNLGLEFEPGAKPDPVFCSEEKCLAASGVNFAHYSGRPEERPVEMQPTFPPPEEFLAPTEFATPSELLGDIQAETRSRIKAFRANADDHDTSCELHDHFLYHIDERGNVFDCLHAPCKCKGKYGNDQGYAAPVQ
jgi:hypothetical protein